MSSKLKFKRASSNPRVTSSNPRVTSSNPRVTSSNSRVTSLNSRVTSSKFTSYQFKSMSSRIIKSMKMEVNSLQIFTRNQKIRRCQFHVKEEFETSICVRISFKKIECLLFCGDSNITYRFA